ncbi:MAG TPA: GDSL-type esterase/lipase family protein [Myxococcota bacterium]|jgi:lysophospholipase L1-like esterase
MRARWKLGVGVAAGLVLLAGIGVAAFPRIYAWRAQDPAFFADEIAAFTAQDAATPPPDAPIVFVGSSSIRLWSTLGEDMAPLPVLNRGFGGSQLSHVIHFVDETIVRYLPRAIVVYAGDNDLDASTGKRAEDVARDFGTLVATVHAYAPGVRIYFLSIKPSRARWERWPEMQRANELIEKLCKGDARLAYVDVATPLLENGAPRDDVYQWDGLHLNAAGYREWTRVVRPLLCAELGPC